MEEEDMGELWTLKECEADTKRKVSTWRKDWRLRRVPFIRIGRQIRIPKAVVKEIVKRGFRPAITAEE